jgi:hypothetical protein
MLNEVHNYLEGLDLSQFVPRKEFEDELNIYNNRIEELNL